jgi:hypothetical protein
MQAVRHSPPYAIELHRAWRIIVPIRGRLSAQVLTEAFATRAAAQEWLGECGRAERRRIGTDTDPTRCPASHERSSVRLIWVNRQAFRLQVQGPQSRLWGCHWRHLEVPRPRTP